MISSLKTLFRLLPELIAIVRSISAMIKEAENKKAQAEAIKEINESFRTKDIKRLNAVLSGKLHDKSDDKKQG